MMSVIQTTVSLVKPRFSRVVFFESRRFKYKSVPADQGLRNAKPVTNSRTLRQFIPSSHKFAQAEVKAIMSRNKEKLEQHSEEDLFELQKVDLTDLKNQMNSLKHKGFLRAYRPYSPPKDLDTRFIKTCSEALGEAVKKEDFSTISFDSKSAKFKVLSALNKEFEHSVHNSRLHEMVTLDDLYIFYESPIDVRTPYEQLHDSSEAGSLPPNLCIQLDPVRFTGEGDHPLDKVTAWPRSNTIISSIHSKEKYPGRRVGTSKFKEDDYE